MIHPRLKQYDCFELAEDLNPTIKKGMIGTVLEVYDHGNAFEVEFVREDGIMYGFACHSEKLSAEMKVLIHNGFCFVEKRNFAYLRKMNSSLIGAIMTTPKIFTI